MFPTRHCIALGLATLCSGAELPGARAAAAADREGIEFFERRIRPVLVERCHECHSARAGKVKGGLSLESRSALLQGGDSGQVLVPGQPERSRLIEAVRYANPDLQMPPKGKLSTQAIADLATWVEQGAPWPEEPVPATEVKKDGFDLAARRERHWAWQPVRPQPPPSVQDDAWPRNPVDRFLLARLEAAGLSPAPPAERRTLLRRLSFDLTGLPPTPRDMAAWLGDASPSAYEKVVDSLLASPRFGERWARHWLDLTRYAETLGHEFDYTNPNAWRYRDYIIRALNEDVPYHQLVREHLAGDLLETPRRHPVEGFNESMIGTSFYWLGQREHSPVDVRQHQAEVIDNQIDVLSKTFLGLTVACARCHDHKFDAISTQDYYALYGMLSSSRYTQAAIDPPAAQAEVTRQLVDLKQRLRQHLARAWSSEAMRGKEYLAAAADLSAAQQASCPDALEETARDLNLNPAQLERWLIALQEAGAAGADHPLVAWITWRQAPQTAPSEGAGSRDSPPTPEPVNPAAPGPEEVLVDFTAGAQNLDGWFFQDEAFDHVPAGELLVEGKSPWPRLSESPALHSGGLSRRLQGVVHSPAFTLARPFIHILAAGRDARINVPVDNFTMIRDPIYGRLKQVLNHDQLRWITIDVSMWKGHRAYLEFSDISAPDPADDARSRGFGLDGYLAVGKVVFSDRAQPPDPAGGKRGAPDRLSRSVPELLAACREAVPEVVAAWTANSPGLARAEARLLQWLVQEGLLGEPSREIEDLLAEYRQLAATIPVPQRVPAMTEGTGLDERVFVRGNPRLPGPVAPRRFLQAIAGTEQPPLGRGSGRLELTERMLDPDNPFVTRVAVNRVWGHVFGRGLVPTPDDFGALGQAPTHPDLLDWLAHWFRTEANWSVKSLVRLLVTSTAYRMSSRPGDAQAEAADPENLFWHRMAVRRLEGEAIRDSILAISGRLEPGMFGEPVAIHLTEFMDGRGRPGRSGPLDGAGRRSIYIEVRRNFVSPMMRAFDLPVPFTTIGRRTVSNVPAQSLILMNDPFVIAEAARWAKRVLAPPDQSPAQRIQTMFQAAFSRPPSPGELGEALDFLELQARAYGVPPGQVSDEPRVWTDLAHVLINVKEFVFLN